VILYVNLIKKSGRDSARYYFNNQFFDRIFHAGQSSAQTDRLGEELAFKTNAAGLDHGGGDRID
jgi:hypothetical protein